VLLTKSTKLELFKSSCCLYAKTRDISYYFGSNMTKTMDTGPLNATLKFIKTLKNVILNLMGQGPLNKKKYPAGIEEIISFRLIPLLTTVSFRCTVPLTVIYDEGGNAIL
jgi:hypothetical protein